MNLIIISAERPEATLLNKYRHNMLARYLRSEGYLVREGSGYYDGQLENLVTVEFCVPLSDDEVSMFQTCADIFEQDYWIEVYNDVAYKHQDGRRIEMGVFWSAESTSPKSVRTSILLGLSGDKGGAYTYIPDIGYFGIQTPEMAKDDAFTAAEKAALAAYGDVDTPRVRSFIYGTPEWLERNASAARTMKY